MGGDTVLIDLDNYIPLDEMDIELSKEIRQYLDDTAYVNEQFNKEYAKYMSEVIKRLR